MTSLASHSLRSSPLVTSSGSMVYELRWKVLNLLGVFGTWQWGP